MQAERTKQFIYDSQTLVAVLEPVEGGWKLVVKGKEIGTFHLRAEALAAIKEIN